MGIGKILLGFVTGGPVGAAAGFVGDLIAPVNGIIKSLADAKVQLKNAENDEQRIYQQERINALNAKLNLQLGEAKFTRMNAMVRTSIGAGVSFLINKILVYDKALGEWTHGRTDPLDPNLWQVVMIVLGFYFVYEVGQVAGSTLTSIFGKK